MVTMAAPAQMTTNTPVNTIADWCAGAVILSILHTVKELVSPNLLCAFKVGRAASIVVVRWIHTSKATDRASMVPIDPLHRA